MAELWLGPVEVSLVLSAPEALSLLTYMMKHNVLVEHQKFIPRKLEVLETVTLRFFRSTYDFDIASVLDNAGIVTVSLRGESETQLREASTQDGGGGVPPWLKR
ncbi:MAG: hypothetical protein HZA34_04660 [Candidatus Pacebacteria bacterium]|nr:hypothetical protein [Candidatus Paceibacterota bacterium]